MLVRAHADPVRNGVLAIRLNRNNRFEDLVNHALRDPDALGLASYRQVPVVRPWRALGRHQDRSPGLRVDPSQREELRAQDQLDVGLGDDQLDVRLGGQRVGQVVRRKSFGFVVFVDYLINHLFSETVAFE